MNIVRTAGSIPRRRICRAGRRGAHISGAKRIEERQILGECLEYCKRESVNILLLSELSRLGRSMGPERFKIDLCLSGDDHIGALCHKKNLPPLINRAFMSAQKG